MKEKIDRDAYLKHALTLNRSEREAIKELALWLPAVIIDSHAHSNLKQHFEEIHPQAFGHMMSTFPYFSIEESKMTHQLFYPLTEIRSLRFPKTFKGINHRAANEYLLNESASSDRVAIYGLPDDIDYTCGALEQKRVSALKMYFSYFIPPATDVYEYFPPEVLRQAESLGIPIILHPPTAITKCWEQILRVKNDFPKLKVSLAHLGLTKVVLPALREVYDRLAGETDIMLDTALNPSEEVVRMAIESFGYDRVMFGSDEPLNLIRSKVYVNPAMGERIITDYPYHWADPKEREEYGHLATGVRHAHWDCLYAIKSALSSLGSAEEEKAKDAIFFGNAEKFFGF